MGLSVSVLVKSFRRRLVMMETVSNTFTKVHKSNIGLLLPGQCIENSAWSATDNLFQENQPV